MFEMNPPVANVSSHLALSRGIVDKFISFIATGDPNTFKGATAAVIKSGIKDH